MWPLLRELLRTASSWGWPKKHFCEVDDLSIFLNDDFIMIFSFIFDSVDYYNNNDQYISFSSFSLSMKESSDMLICLLSHVVWWYWEYKIKIGMETITLPHKLWIFKISLLSKMSQNKVDKHGWCITLSWYIVVRHSIQTLTPLTHGLCGVTWFEVLQKILEVSWAKRISFTFFQLNIVSNRESYYLFLAQEKFWIIFDSIHHLSMLVVMINYPSCCTAFYFTSWHWCYLTKNIVFCPI